MILSIVCDIWFCGYIDYQLWAEVVVFEWSYSLDHYVTWDSIESYRAAYLTLHARLVHEYPRVVCHHPRLDEEFSQPKRVVVTNAPPWITRTSSNQPLCYFEWLFVSHALVLVLHRQSQVGKNLRNRFAVAKFSYIPCPLITIWHLTERLRYKWNKNTIRDLSQNLQRFYVICYTWIHRILDV